MLKEKDYCDYDTCVALIEMGFVGTSRYYYDKKNHKLHITNYGITYTVRTASASDYVLAIHLYDAQKWLRKEKGINISPVYLFTDWGCIIKTPKYGDLIESHSSYEEALLEGIKETLKILKEDNNDTGR